MPATLTLKAFPDRDVQGQGRRSSTRCSTRRRARSRSASTFAEPERRAQARDVRRGRAPGRARARALRVPADAVIDSGTREASSSSRSATASSSRARSQLGDSRRRTSSRSSSGLEAGERVVTRANFLVDSESRLRASLRARRLRRRRRAEPSRSHASASAGQRSRRHAVSHDQGDHPLLRGEQVPRHRRDARRARRSRGGRCGTSRSTRIPDLSDTQVIVYSRWDRSPDIIEDQVTYPIITALLGAPKVKAIRGFSDFGFSLRLRHLRGRHRPLLGALARPRVPVARSSRACPQGVKTELGPDATERRLGLPVRARRPIGQALDSPSCAPTRTGSCATRCSRVPGVAEVATVGGFVQAVPGHRRSRTRSPPTSSRSTHVDRRDPQGQQRGRRAPASSSPAREYMVRGRGYVKIDRGHREDRRQDRTSRARRSCVARRRPRSRSAPRSAAASPTSTARATSVGGIVVMRQGENALNVIERVKAKLEELEAVAARRASRSSRPTTAPSSSSAPIDTLQAQADRGDDHRLARHPHLPLARPVGDRPDRHDPGLGAPRVHPDVPHGAEREHHVARRDRDLDRRARRRRHRRGRERLQASSSSGSPAAGKGDFHAGAPRGAARRSARRSSSRCSSSRSRSCRSSRWSTRRAGSSSRSPTRRTSRWRSRRCSRSRSTRRCGCCSRAWTPFTFRPRLARVARDAGRSSARTTPRSSTRSAALLLRVYEPAVPLRAAAPEGDDRGRASLLVVADGPGLPAARLRVHAAARRGRRSSTCRRRCPACRSTEAQRILQIQDRILRTFPEVERVFGKAGRADTSTDPAPFSMMETTVAAQARVGVAARSRAGTRPGRRRGCKRAASRRSGPTASRTTSSRTRWTAALQLPGHPERLDDADQEPHRHALDRHPHARSASRSSAPTSTRSSGSARSSRRIVRDGPGHAQRLRRARRRRLLPRLRCSSATRSPATASSVDDAKTIVMTAIGGETGHDDRRGPRALRGQRPLRARATARTSTRCARVLVPTPSGAQIPMAQIADIQLVAGPVDDPRRERPARRLRLRRLRHREARRRRLRRGGEAARSPRSVELPDRATR